MIRVFLTSGAVAVAVFFMAILLCATYEDGNRVAKTYEKWVPTFLIGSMLVGVASILGIVLILIWT